MQILTNTNIQFMEKRNTAVDKVIAILRFSINQYQYTVYGKT